MKMSFTILMLLSCLSYGHGANILGIFPCPSISHQLPYQALMKALAAKGHQVVVISPDPLKTPFANYTDIDVSFSYELMKLFNFVEAEKVGMLVGIHAWIDVFGRISDAQLASPQVLEFMKSNRIKFDVIIMEKILFQPYYGLVHHLGSPPVIGIISMGGLSPSFEAFGNPNNPAYTPNLFAPFSDHMTFWQRMYNTYLYVSYGYIWKFKMFPRYEAIMRKHFGFGPPPIYESEYNDSMLILNNHWSTNYPRPLLPNVIELSGVHVETTTKPLPKDIQTFLDGAKHGAIFFSLGSNVKSAQLPKEKVKQFLDAFAELPQRVLWKWESDSVPEIPSNVMVGRWLPQQSILAHPNIRAFITQGGLQSFQEAACYKIPLLAIPFMSDQENNVAKYQAAGVGIRMSLGDVTKESLLKALEELINTTRYYDNMKKLSEVYLEQKEKSLDLGVYWVEYVIRHNGARHLRSAALDLTWYQYLLLDVIAVFILGLVLFFILCYIVLKAVISLIKRYLFSSKLKKS